MQLYNKHRGHLLGLTQGLGEPFVISKGIVMVNLDRRRRRRCKDLNSTQRPKWVAPKGIICIILMQIFSSIRTLILREVDLSIVSLQYPQRISIDCVIMTFLTLF